MSIGKNLKALGAGTIDNLSRFVMRGLSFGLIDEPFENWAKNNVRKMKEIDGRDARALTDLYTGWGGKIDAEKVYQELGPVQGNMLMQALQTAKGDPRILKENFNSLVIASNKGMGMPMQTVAQNNPYMASYHANMMGMRSQMNVPYNPMMNVNPMMNMPNSPMNAMPMQPYNFQMPG
ncbi:MAG: hypothetical protein AAGJ35_02030 [Myxococcota bacterium]